MNTKIVNAKIFSQALTDEEKQQRLQCLQRQQEEYEFTLDNQPNSQIFTPLDQHLDWSLAKLCVQIADANHHEMSSHLGRTHLVMEPFAIATARQLAENHPLGLLWF